VQKGERGPGKKGSLPPNKTHGALSADHSVGTSENEIGGTQTRGKKRPRKLNKDHNPKKKNRTICHFLREMYLN